MQTEALAWRPKLQSQSCQTDEDCDQEDPEHLTPRRRAPKGIVLEEQAKIDELQRVQTRQQHLQSQTLIRNRPFVMELPAKYHGQEGALLGQTEADSKTVYKYAHKTVVAHTSGSRREIYPDGYSAIFFENGDIRQTFPQGRTVYFFKEGQVTRTDLANGDSVLLFETGQLEKHMADGSKLIYFRDGSKKFLP